MKTKGILLIALLTFFLHDCFYACKDKKRDDRPVTSRPKTKTPAFVVVEIIGDYKVFENILGSGSYGVVKLAEHKITGERVAIKILDRIKLKSDKDGDKILKLAFDEARIMENLPHHRYIIDFKKFIKTEENLYLVIEYAPHSDLYKDLEKHGKMNENRARFIFKQVVEAVKHCHENGVVHRDLKTGNVLLDINNNTKLADFGFATEFVKDKKLDLYCGTQIYTAPEIKDKTNYNGCKLDIWLLGTILYELTCGIISDTTSIATLVHYETLRIPEGVSVDCKDLIFKMLQKTPENRSTIIEILADKWFTKQDEKQNNRNQRPKATRGSRSGKV